MNFDTRIMNIGESLKNFRKTIADDVTLVAVSKIKPVADLMEAYKAGQRVFGENKIQEMEMKWQEMPQDVEWHMIGHVQRNKVKIMAPFVHLVHAVDSLKLLKEIDKEANKNNRIIDCLLQIKIAQEDSKYGMSEKDAELLLNSEIIDSLKNIRLKGFMGMATFTDDKKQISREFQKLKLFYDRLKERNKNFSILSMGMSGDYKIAIENGSNMIRVGSAIFGER